MDSMFIDFENLDLNSKKLEYSSDDYFNFVLDFIETVTSKDRFASRTSGSTGIPKEIVIEKKRAIASAKVSNQYFKINANTSMLLCLDIKFIGSKMLIIRAWTAKSKLTIAKPSLQFYEKLGEKKFDFVSLTPIHILHILEHCPPFFDSIQQCLIGGSAVSAELKTKIHEQKRPTIFYESFGMTETISHFAVKNISAHDLSFDVLDGFEISTDDENRLCVYHPEILPEKIMTNDIVEIIDEKHFNWLGRMDNVINSSGMKINPEMLEEQLRALVPTDFILAGIAEGALGQQLVMILKDRPLQTKTELIARMKQSNLPSYCIPKEIYLCAEWMETPNMKPVRKVIIENRILF